MSSKWVLYPIELLALSMQAQKEYDQIILNTHYKKKHTTDHIKNCTLFGVHVVAYLVPASIQCSLKYYVVYVHAHVLL